MKTKPVQIKLGNGSFFTCSCGSTEFKTMGEPTNWFCRCGRVYTQKDISTEEEP